MPTRISRTFAAFAICGTLTVAAPAIAGGVNWSLDIGVGGGYPAYPAYYPPAPVYYPPPVVNNNYSNYYAPPIIYGATPVYTAPPPVVVYGRSYYHYRPLPPRPYPHHGRGPYGHGHGHGHGHR